MKAIEFFRDSNLNQDNLRQETVGLILSNNSPTHNAARKTTKLRRILFTY